MGQLLLYLSSLVHVVVLYIMHSSGGHTCPKPEVFTKSCLRPERWDPMFWNLGPHYMCKWAAVFVSFVTPHLKDDYFIKRLKYQFKTSTTRCCILIGSQNDGLCPPPPQSIFKSCQFGEKANSHSQLPVQWIINFLFSSQNARKLTWMGETSNFTACVCSPSPFIINKALNFVGMPMLLIKHPITTFNPDSPKGVSQTRCKIAFNFATDLQDTLL